MGFLCPKVLIGWNYEIGSETVYKWKTDQFSQDDKELGSRVTTIASYEKESQAGNGCALGNHPMQWGQLVRQYRSYKGFLGVKNKCSKIRTILRILVGVSTLSELSQR